MILKYIKLPKCNIVQNNIVVTKIRYKFLNVVNFFKSCFPCMDCVVWWKYNTEVSDMESKQQRHMCLYLVNLETELINTADLSF